MLRHFTLLSVALLLACTRVHAEDLPPGAKALRDLPYVTKGHERQKLDLYLPAQPKGPLMVWIHGGGWVAGSKDEVKGLGLLGKGYAVASLNYRYSNQAPFPAQIEDCKAALRWLRAHAAEYGYDPKRIVAVGGSAGGHLTALLATTGNVKDFDVGENLDQSSAIQCGVDEFGPTDFPGWKPVSANPAIQRSGPESLLTKLLGGEMADHMDLAKRASPITWVTKETAPLYIQHGTADPLVGVEQSKEFAEKLKAAGVEVTLDIIEGGSHGGAEFWTPARLMAIVAFMDKHLGATN